MTRRGMLLSLGAVGAIVLLVAGAGLLPAFLNPSRSPAAASASPSASSARTQDPTRYDDGIPREWEGQPVLRVQAALDRAAQSTHATSFYIGLWYSSQPPSWGCPPTEPTPLSCTALHDVGDRAGVLWPALGRALRIEVDASDGPIVLRVHTHDPRWSNPANCAAAELDACVHLMIGDGIAWNGDAVTAPRPVTVEQAAAAFGVPEGDTTLSSWSSCLAGVLPGVRLLPFRDPESSTGYIYGAIAVFPSAQALAIAAPDAATLGETDVVPITLQLHTPAGFGAGCAYDGTISLRVHWLARANVLVGVFYETSVGPAADQWVVLARGELERLPAG